MQEHQRKNESKIGAIPKGTECFFVLYFHWKSGDFACNILFHGTAPQIERLNLAMHKGFSIK